MRFLVASLVLALSFPAATVDAQSPTHRLLRRMMPQRHSYTHVIRTADFDADGDLDFASAGTKGIHLGLWSGDAGFVEKSDAFPVVWGGVVAMTAGDLDGDGAAEVIESTVSAGGRVWHNLGDATFQQVGWLSPSGITALLDLDQDGDLDVYASGAPGSVWVNQSPGVFAAKPVAGAIYNASGLAVADANGDGRDDVFQASWVSAEQLFLSTGTDLVLSPATFFPNTLTGGVAAGDVDGDGRVDVVFGGASTGTGAPAGDRLYLGQADGTFLLSPVALPHLGGAGDMLLVDLDSDADLDLVQLGDQPHVYENPGNGLFFNRTPAQKLGFQTGHTGAAGDFDGDGDQDLVVQADGADYLAVGSMDHLLLNDGSLHLFDHDYGTPPYVFDAALGDLDGDQDVDAFLIGGPDKWSVVVNDGGGRMTTQSSALPPAPTHLASLSAALGDLDGDGDLDAYVGNYGGTDLLCRNHGGLEFVYEVVDATPYLEVNAVALGDVDLDGDLDVAVGTRSDDLDFVWHNDGTGAFPSGAELPPPAWVVADVLLEDVDLDGDLDAFRSFLGSVHPAQWDSNDGAGHFAPLFTLVASASSLHAPEDAEVLDADMDGDLDVLIADDPLRYYRNDGLAAGFVDLSATLAPVYVDEVAVIDLDRDGDPDFVTDGPHEFENQGGGAFLPAPGLIAVGENVLVQNLWAADLDGDLDEDLLATWTDGTFVLTNVERQLARRRLPSVGKPFALDVFGPAGEPWFVAASPAKAAIDLPPYGTLRLAPTGLVLLASGLLDGGGAGAIETVLPASPTLVGAKLYTQALVGAAPAFTNFELLSFSAL